MLFDITSTIKLNLYHLCTVIQLKLVLQFLKIKKVMIYILCIIYVYNLIA